MKKSATIIFFTLLYFITNVHANQKFDKILENIPKNKIFAIKFNQKINQNQDFYKLINLQSLSGDKISFSFSFSDDKKTLFIHPPKAGYKNNTTYFLTINKALTSKIGKNLKNDYIIKFTTEPNISAYYDLKLSGLTFIKTITVKNHSSKEAYIYKIDGIKNELLFNKPYTLVLPNDKATIYLYQKFCRLKNK